MSELVRKAEIDAWLVSLLSSLKVVPPFELAPLKSLHAEKNYTQLISRLMDAMHITARMRVGYVNSGGPESAPAWIACPVKLPPYGTHAFKQTRFTLFLRRSFLLNDPVESILAGIGHEFAHIVLNSIGHPLKRQEEAVDLTAMILGLAQIYVLGCEHVEEEKRRVKVTWWQEPLRAIQNYIEPEVEVWEKRTRYGYLDSSEVTYAAKRIASWKC
jgi:hypothetical protein